MDLFRKRDSFVTATRLLEAIISALLLSASNDNHGTSQPQVYQRGERDAPKRLLLNNSLAVCALSANLLHEIKGNKGTV